MIPWIILAVVVVPLVVIAFAATRRKSASAPPYDDPKVARQFEEAEKYEAEWHEKDADLFHDERLP